MNIFQNLCPHESLLLILGVVLFSVLIFLLIWKTMKEMKIGVLLPFFLLPIIMIAYPSIGSVQYQEGKLQFNTMLAQYMEGNISDENFEEFRDKYQLLAESCKSNHDAEMLTSFAEAQFATGNFEEAAEMAERSLNVRPNFTRARMIQENIRIQKEQEEEFIARTDRLERLISTLEAGEVDERRMLNAISRELSEIRMPQNIETQRALTVARALSYIGENERADQLLDRTLAAPGITERETREAMQLKSNIEDNTVSLQTRPETEARQAVVENPSLSVENLTQQRLKSWIWMDQIRSN